MTPCKEATEAELSSPRGSLRPCVGDHALESAAVHTWLAALAHETLTENAPNKTASMKQKSHA